MSKLTKRLNSVFVFALFLFSCTRLAFARVWPFSPSSQKPPSVKVFALSEAAWLELRAGDGAAQDKSGSKSGDDKKEPSKGSEDKKERAKADCDKGKDGDDKKNASPNADDKKKDAPKSGECDNAGPGGGDGDTGGGGG